MAKRRNIRKLLLVATSLISTTISGVPSVLAHGGGHCGGGHCGGSHFSGAHFSSSHFGGSHHMSGGTHFGGGHISTTHVSSKHFANPCTTNMSNSGQHGFSLFGEHTHSMARMEQSSGIRAAGVPNSSLHLQEISGRNESPSPYCSSIVRSSTHTGFFGHLHRMFGGGPCELQNIHTEIMPQMSTQLACAPVPCSVHQNFTRENLALNQITSQAKYLRSNATRVRFLDQLNRNFYAAQLPENYFSVNVDNTPYPATDLDTVIDGDNATRVETDVVAENEVPPFSGLSYMLPNPVGILSIYFSHESSINNFLQLHKASFLAAAMHQLM